MTRDIVIFDLDGTLIDSMGPLEALFCDMLAERCAIDPSASAAVYAEFLGAGPRVQFEAALRRHGRLDTISLDEITSAYWEDAESYEPEAFPETREVLKALQAAHHTLLVSSGGTTASVKRKTRLAGIDGMVRLMLGTDEGVEHMAKGPGHFHLILQVLDLDEAAFQQRAVFVGDAAHDMRVGRAAGLPAIGRLTGDNGPALRDAGATHLISDLREIPALLMAL
ncbi:MAG TPA: HAD family hydrolase [Dehalococcoidia bacterium]|nr:HAD family hydrolase [Dehalococcoidia bacterium]